MLKIGVLGSGSKGNSLAVCHGADTILIDAGFSRRELLHRMEKLSIDPATVRCVLLTHEHSDHLSGARIFCDDLGIPLCAAGAVLAARKKKAAQLPKKLWSFEPGENFSVGSFEVESFSVQHDAIDPCGFVIHAGSVRIGVATDLGEVGPMVRRHLSNCEVLVLESNYDLEMLRCSQRAQSLKNRIAGRNGHLDNKAAATALESLLGERSSLLLLAHRSSECNTEELVRAEIETELRKLNLALPYSILSQDHCFCAECAGSDLHFSCRELN